MGFDQILHHYVLDHEGEGILWECHVVINGGHVGCKATARNVLQASLWWTTLFKDAKEYAKTYDVFQRVGQPLRHDEMPLNLVHALTTFEKWVFDFIGPKNPPALHSHARYIITITYYLTCAEEVAPVEDYNADTVSRFIFDNIITRFGCPHNLESDQGSHFINEKI